MPKRGMEKVIQINQRGLIPRNIVTPEKKSKLIQRKCQIANQKEKVEHIVDIAVSNNIATVVTTYYADDELQSYEEQVNGRLASSISSQEHQTTGGRLVGYEEANTTVDILSYNDCAYVEFEKVGDKTTSDFRKFVLADGSNAETIQLIDTF